MFRRPILLSLFLLYSAILVGGGFVMGQSGWPLTPLGIATSSVPPEAEETFSPFWEVWNLANDRYFQQPLDPEELTGGAIDGMLATLDDPHTRYLPPAEEEQARQDIEGELEGIGVLVEMLDGNITVVAPFEGSPAEEAGLEPGDILREADGIDLSEKRLEEAAEIIRGPAGSTVHLVIQRGDSQFEVDVTRDVIRIPSVRGEILENDIAYVRLSRFRTRTLDELRDVLGGLLEEDPSGLILDLRSNPGGGLDTVIDIADEFLAEGVVLLERFGSGRERVYESSDSGVAEEVPMVVLIDEGSASASEVLAGAIRDRGRGILIGQTSFGKGTVQTWHALSNGGGVRITIARWLTPEGTWVNEEGLTPDLVVPLPEPADGEAPEDTQLQAAIDYLAGRQIGDGLPEGSD